MKRSIISRKSGRETVSQTSKKLCTALAVVFFWLAVWQLAYLAVAQEILLVSPVHAVMRLFSLAGQQSFWLSILSSCLRVLAGFAAAVAVGCALTIACARFKVLRLLTAPLMGVIRATPVASFIILALVWMATDRIPAFIAFLVVVPIVWGNLTAGFESVDKQLLEMARVFGLSRGRVLRYIYLPAEAPHFASACSAGLGLAWKSAVAAEVIALPRLAIGRQIYSAKIYLETADLFAWTMAVIFLSFLIEKLAIRLLRLLTDRLSGPRTAEGGSAHAAGA